MYLVYHHFFNKKIHTLWTCGARTQELVKEAEELVETCQQSNKKDILRYKCTKTSDLKWIEIDDITGMPSSPIPENFVPVCTDIHVPLEFSKSGFVIENSICCLKCHFFISTLKIGDLFDLNTVDVFTLGQCMWIGIVNGEPCSMSRMKQQPDTELSVELQERCIGSALTDRLAILPVSLTERIVNAVSTVDLGTSLRLQTNLGRCPGLHDTETFLDVIGILGARMAFLRHCFSIDRVAVWVFGTLTWVGKINGVDCAGLKLDFPDDELLDNDKTAVDNTVIVTTMCITLDEEAYMPAFTADRKSMTSDESWDPDLGHPLLREKQLSIGDLVFVHIEKGAKRVTHTGLLVWFGQLGDSPMAVVELTSGVGLGRHKNILSMLPPNMSEVSDESPFRIPVNPLYLAKYKNLRWTESHKDDVSCVVYNSKICNGIVRWRGVNTTDQLYYGVELNNYCNHGTNGTFSGQNLFECNKGHGVFVSAKRLRYCHNASLAEHRDVDERLSGSGDENLTEILRIFIDYAQLGDDEIKKLIDNAVKVPDIKVLKTLLEKYCTRIDLRHQNGLVLRLVREKELNLLSSLLNDGYSCFKNVKARDEKVMVDTDIELLTAVLECMQLQDYTVISSESRVKLCVNLLALCSDVNQPIGSVLDDCSESDEAGEPCLMCLVRIPALNETDLIDLIESMGLPDSRCQSRFDICTSNYTGETAYQLLAERKFWSVMGQLISIQPTHFDNQVTKKTTTLTVQKSEYPSMESGFIEEISSIGDSQSKSFGKCCKCLEAPITRATICGHLFCEDCLLELDSCCVCETKIKKRIKLYF